MTLLPVTTPSAAARRTRAPRRAAAILAALLAGLALLSGCTQAPQEQPATATTTSPSPTASPTPTPTPTTASPTPTPSPTPVPSPFPTATAPTARLDAGTVGETDPVTVEGTGPSRVEVTRDGDFALVVSVDCPECIRPVTVTGPDQTEPLLSGPAPYRGAALFAVNEPDADEQELWVFADAEWHLGIESWNDIQPTFGELEGFGLRGRAGRGRGGRVRRVVRPAARGVVHDQRLLGRGDDGDRRTGLPRDHRADRDHRRGLPPAAGRGQRDHERRVAHHPVGTGVAGDGEA